MFLPELAIDIEAEAERLRGVMDEVGNVNIFLSEGAGMHEIVAAARGVGRGGASATRSATSSSTRSTRASGSPSSSRSSSAPRRPWCRSRGYFSRAAAANAEDLRLIKSMTDLAVECALRGESGVIGHDEEDGDRLKAIAFPRIAGGKAFDVTQAVVRRAPRRHRPAARAGRPAEH